jgi:hypothetical protein
MASAQSDSTDIGMSTEGGNVSEIQALADRVRDLSQSVDRWNIVMLWGLALAAVAAVVIGISTRLVVVRTGQQSGAQEMLNSAKDRQLALDLKAKDAQIELAKKGAAEATATAKGFESKIADSDARVKSAEAQVASSMARSGEAVAQVKTADARIAEAQRDAARANETAERERLARVQLEARLADRTLSPQQQTTLTATLAPFRGVSIDAVTFGDTTEIGRIAGILIGAFQRAGWVVHTAQAGGGERTVTGILIGTRPGSDANIARAANVLVSTLQSMGIAAGPWSFDQMPLPGIRFNTSVTGDTALRVFIGSKP